MPFGCTIASVRLAGRLLSCSGGIAPPSERIESSQTLAQFMAIDATAVCRALRLSRRDSPRKHSLSQPTDEERSVSAAVEFAIPAHFQGSSLHFALWTSHFYHRQDASLDRLGRVYRGMFDQPGVFITAGSLEDAGVPNSVHVRTAGQEPNLR